MINTLIMKLFYKVIYSSTVNFMLRNTNKLLRGVFPKVKIPPSGLMKIPLGEDKTIKFKTNQTDFVAFCVYWNGLYAYEYTWLFEKISNNLKGFIDIGSNGGLYSLIAAKTSDEIKILAFDPTRAANFFFNENIRLNNFSDRINFYNYAVSDKIEKLNFYEVKNRKYPYLKYNLGGSSSLVNHPKLYNKVSVQAVSLDGFLDENPDLRFEIDFIKIDAEGAEPNIIRGMKSTIEKYKPIIVCEVLLDEAGDEIETLLEEFGYRFFLNKSRVLIPTEKIRRNESDDEIYDYFFVHPSKLEIIEAFIRPTQSG